MLGGNLGDVRTKDTIDGISNQARTNLEGLKCRELQEGH